MNNETKEKSAFSNSLIRDEQAKAFNSWQAPEVTGHSVNRDVVDLAEQANKHEATAAQSIEDINKQAYEEAYQLGLEDGKQAGLASLQTHIQAIQSLQQSISSHANEFDEDIAEQLLQIAIAVAKQIIRRELTTNPEEIIAVVREAISLMPNQTDQITLKLHPEDAKLIREIYDMQKNTEISWVIFEDPAIQRGGCIITSEYAELNAELDKRVQSIVQQLLGGERSDD